MLVDLQLCVQQQQQLLVSAVVCLCVLTHVEKHGRQQSRLTHKCLSTEVVRSHLWHVCCALPEALPVLSCLVDQDHALELTHRLATSKDVHQSGLARTWDWSGLGVCRGKGSDGLRGDGCTCLGYASVGQGG